MKKEALEQLVFDVREAWEATIDELGPDGLERPGATGEWRVRDVLAHFNGWDRWQLVQLRSAFTGEAPTDAELTGNIDFPENDSMHEDAMNAMFVEGNRGRPLESVVGDWREVSGMRIDWVAAATQDQLDTTIGADWTGGTNRIFRLQSEVPGVANPERVWQRIVDQVEHQKEHLRLVREWMGSRS